MKILLCSLLLITAVSCFGDIQDPPANDYGPTRKLGRAISNLCPVFAFEEVSNSIAQTNMAEGNSAAATYGVVKGLGRFFARMGFGWYEFATFPFPTYKGSYRPFYRDNIPWIHGGFEEFPPELGFKTKYDYTQENTAYN
jgi:putative exosortase-associated protein (TIGR04073 family)